MRLLSAHALYASRRAVVALLVATLAMQLAAGLGLAWVAGFGAVEGALRNVNWPWLGVLVGALVVSFLGYHHAYRGMFATSPHWSLPHRQMVPVALAGFGGFLAHGATEIDLAALRTGGADRREASVRVSGFGGLEYGVLALGGSAAAIVVLALGLDKPPPSFTLPWAIIPVPGFLVAFWLARRYGDRLSAATGWRGGIGIFLESIDVVRRLFLHPMRRDSAVLGMAAFWAGDACAAWSGLAMFGFHMKVAALIVGFATGMLVTRRTAPLAGAGLLAVALPVTLWLSGAPLAVAIPGIFVYHVMTLWLPIPGSLATMRTLRGLVESAGATGAESAAAGGGTGSRAARVSAAGLAAPGQPGTINRAK